MCKQQLMHWCSISYINPFQAGIGGLNEPASARQTAWYKFLRMNFWIKQMAI